MVKNKKVFVHFSSVDPILSSLSKLVVIEEVAPRHPRYFFTSLISEIIGQQLSGKVANVIEGRFKKLFKGPITPQKVASMQDERLRGTGMSWSKVRFIKDLAHKIIAREIHLPSLVTRTDEEVIQELVKVKGIGHWTAEMFLMFTLGREDVFSFGDLGLRRAIQKSYGMKKEPSVSAMTKISTKWKPYRTWAAKILWKSLELPSL